MGGMVPLRLKYGDRTFVFTQSEVTVGREAGADVVIDVPDVSRLHSVISWVDGEWRYADNSSRNGTYLAGNRVADVRIDRPVTLNLAGRSGPEITLSPATDPSRSRRMGSRSPCYPRRSRSTWWTSAGRPA